MSIIVNLAEELEKEVDHNERVFSGLGLIGHFTGLWPSLCDLHTWIFVHWEPILEVLFRFPACSRIFCCCFLG